MSTINSNNNVTPLEGNAPCVLFVGNGLNRAFSNNFVSMDKLKTEITSDKFTMKDEDIQEAGIPFPLEAVLRTGDHVRSAMKNVSQDLYGSIDNDEQKSFMRKILSAGFDDIITTNYSYEFETACEDSEKITDYRLSKMLSHTDEVKKAEPRFNIHTYNKAKYNGITNRIWHIHGEARKPESMIFGHYYYGNLLCKYKELSDKRGDSYHRAEKEGQIYTPKSWIDSFILGDVHIIGFGMDLSEMDIWWLIYRKKREKADAGKTVFYSTQPEKSYERIKYALLESYEVEVRTYDVFNNDFKSLYYRMFEDITNDMNRKREMDESI